MVLWLSRFGNGANVRLNLRPSACVSNNSREDKFILDEIHETIQDPSVEILLCSYEKCNGFESRCRNITCGSSFQTGSVRSDESSVSTLTRLSYTDLKRTAGNVTAVELHVDDVDPVLARDEANGVFV